MTTEHSRVTPAMGGSFEVRIGELKEGEHWRITTSGKTLAHDVAARSGSVTRLAVEGVAGLARG